VPLGFKDIPCSSVADLNVELILIFSFFPYSWIELYIRLMVAKGWLPLINPIVYNHSRKVLGASHVYFNSEVIILRVKGFNGQVVLLELVNVVE
jgi:hypothetical protein